MVAGARCARQKMHIDKFTYASGSGWSVPKLPDGDSEDTLVLVFAGQGFIDDDAPLRVLRAAYPRAKMLGCSTAGEIHGTSIEDASLSVAVAHFDKSKLRAAVAPVPTQADSFAAGENVARALAGDDLRAVFVLSDGLSVNGSELLRGINSRLPASVVVTGGLAGDGSRFQRTWVLEEGVPAEHRVSAIGFYGDDLCVSHGSRGGWDIFGPERVVTRSKGNVLYELDGQPALALYKRYLGDRAAGLPATALLFPLAVRAAETDPVLVRTILAVNEEDNSMTFAGDVPQGARAQLMRANFDRLIEGAGMAAVATGGSAARPDGEVDSLVVAISCVGRRIVLGERTEEEVEAAAHALAPGAALVGFYSYGELSPVASGRCELHNQTMTITRIAEV